MRRRKSMVEAALDHDEDGGQHAAGRTEGALHRG